MFTVADFRSHRYDRRREGLFRNHENKIRSVNGAWSGLTPDDTPLFTRDAGSQEIYTFDLELP